MTNLIRFQNNIGESIVATHLVGEDVVFTFFEPTDIIFKSSWLLSLRLSGCTKKTTNENEAKTRIFFKRYTLIMSRDLRHTIKY